MVKIILEITNNDLKLTKNSKEVATKGLNYTSQEFIRTLQQNSPVDTGLLRQWAITSSDEYTREIQSPAKYASYVNDGTGIFGPAHQKITPHNASGVLVFQQNGQTIFAKSVKGQKGQKFVEKSIEQTSSKIADFFIRAAQEVGI